MPDERLLTHHVNYYPQLKKLINSTRAVVFLSHAILLTTRAAEPPIGWFTKTLEAWEAETGLTRLEQQRAARLLADQRLLEQRFAGTPRRLYFHACLEAIKSALRDQKPARLSDGIRSEAVEPIKNKTKQNKDHSTFQIHSSNQDRNIQDPSNLASASQQKRSRIAKDLRSKHPAVVAIKRITGRYPSKLWWDDIIELVGEEPDYKLLTSCAKEWVKKNKNVQDVSVWLLDWYPQGNHNGNGHKQAVELYVPKFKSKL